MAPRPPNHSKEANQLRWGFVLAVLAFSGLVLFLIWTTVKNWGREELPAATSREPVAVASMKQRPPPAAARTAIEPPIENSGAEIFGKVFLEGTPPPEKNIALDPQSETNWAGPKTTRHFLVDRSGGLANVLVYVKSGLEGKNFSVPNETIQVELGHGKINPYVFAAELRQNCKFIYGDSLKHSMRLEGLGPDFLSLKNSFRTNETLSNAAQYRLFFIPNRCEMHPWELAFGSVIEHPFFSVTSPDGTFKFPERLPPGNYVIAARHQKLGEILKDVTIETNESQRKMIFKMKTNVLADSPGKEISSDLPVKNQNVAGNEAENNLETPAPIPTGGAGGARILQGTVKGRVFLEGPPPPERTIEMDVFCGRSHPKPVTTRHFVVSRDGGLANVFIYLKEGLDDMKIPAPQQEPVLDQVGCMFEPYILGVMTNHRFKIRNSDPFLHNVHATPKMNEEFNFGQMTRGENHKSFSKPEIFVRMKCDVHNWMFAYIAVVDHPVFAVTDENGFFQLPYALPEGKYVLAAAHQKSGKEITQPLVVNFRKNNEVVFKFKSPMAR